MEEREYERNYLTEPTNSFEYQSPMTKYSGSIETLTNPEDDLFKLELALRSIKVSKNNAYIQLDKPLLNESGIMRMMGIAQSLINQITILSNYEDKEVTNLMRAHNRIIVRTLGKNRRHFEIRKPFDNTRSIIHNMILNMGMATLKRAYKQGEKNFWKGTQHDVKQTIVSNNENKGFFGRLFKGGS